MRRHLAVTGLALLVLLNIVLVYLAVENGRGDAPPASEASGADSDQGSGTPSGGAGTSEGGGSGDGGGNGGSDSNSNDNQAPAEAIATLADMSGDLLLWGPAAPCQPEAGEITLYRATPGGDAASFTVEGLTGLRAITVEDDSSATITGTDADCSLVGATTDDAGQTWETAEVSGWSLPSTLAPPGQAQAAAGPGGPIDVDCAPAQVFGFDDSVVRLQCRDNRLLTTWTGGGEWSELGRPEWAEAIHYATIPAAVAVTTAAEECSVALRRTIDGGSTWRDPFCVDEADEAEGPWGIAADGDGQYVVMARERLWWSTDGGETFSEAGIAP